MSFEHISAPLSRAIETCARNYAKGHPMFDKNQLPDIKIRETKAALHAAWNAAIDAENALDDGATDADFEKARAAVKAAGTAATEFDTPDVMEDYESDQIHCAACGAPLWEDDEVVTDPVTDEVFLRVAIGLPPRQAVKQLLPDMEDVA